MRWWLAREGQPEEAVVDVLLHCVGGTTVCQPLADHWLTTGSSQGYWLAGWTPNIFSGHKYSNLVLCLGRTVCRASTHVYVYNGRFPQRWGGASGDGGRGWQLAVEVGTRQDQATGRKGEGLIHVKGMKGIVGRERLGKGFGEGEFAVCR